MKKIANLTHKLRILLLASILTLVLSACAKQEPAKQHGQVLVVTTSNVYADIAQQVLGKYGTAQALIKNSSADPHDFEPKTSDAKLVSDADLVVANGLGYDDWMNNLASATDHHVLRVGEDLLGLKKGVNPHIWYDLKMPVKYVNYLVQKCAKLDPKHQKAFKHNGQVYLTKVHTLQQKAASIKAKNSKVYVSEPVFDYALTAAGFKVANPDFEKAIQNETDPSPAAINQMTAGIKKRQIAFFVNNEQETSTTINRFLKLAKQYEIPVVAVRETIPNNTSYLEWMQDNYQKLKAAAQQ